MGDKDDLSEVVYLREYTARARSCREKIDVSINENPIFSLHFLAIRKKFSYFSYHVLSSIHVSLSITKQEVKVRLLLTKSIITLLDPKTVVARRIAGP